MSPLSKVSNCHQPEIKPFLKEPPSISPPACLAITSTTLTRDCVYDCEAQVAGDLLPIQHQLNQTDKEFCALLKDSRFIVA